MLDWERQEAKAWRGPQGWLGQYEGLCYRFENLSGVDRRVTRENLSWIVNTHPELFDWSQASVYGTSESPNKSYKDAVWEAKGIKLDPSDSDISGKLNFDREPTFSVGLVGLTGETTRTSD